MSIETKSQTPIHRKAEEIPTPVRHASSGVKLNKRERKSELKLIEHRNADDSDEEGSVLDTLNFLPCD